MKLWERIIKQKLRQETNVSENQVDFMPERLKMEAVYTLRRSIERVREKKDLQMAFIDL